MKEYFKRARWLLPHQGSGHPDYITLEIGIELDKIGYSGINEPYKVSRHADMLTVDFNNIRLPEKVIRRVMDILGYDILDITNSAES